jgi:segregation and condensation protein A
MVRDGPAGAGHRSGGPAQRPCTDTTGETGIVGLVVALVSTPAFEGPCDVLLQLISDHKLDIYDIPLADIVEGFLAQLAAVETFDLGVTTEFLVIAAILVELKSRKLLPGADEVDDDEELSGFEERDRLLARLLELQAYAAAADAFCILIEQAARSVPRQAGLDEEFRELAPDLLVGITPERLAAAFLLGSSPRQPLILDLSHVTVEAVTVSEAVDELEGRLPGAGTVSFRTLTAHCVTRMQIIVRFLALLELCKRGWIALDQGELFGDLAVTWTAPAHALSVVGAGDGIEEYDG